MIQATELRIGNWVNFMEDDTKFIVSEVVKTGIGVENSEESTWIELDQFNGIPLTPSILEKAGFEKIQEGSMAYPEVWRIKYTQVLVGSVIDIQIRGSEEIAWIEGNTIVHIHYVHQLQNLIYAITKQELTINL